MVRQARLAQVAVALARRRQLREIPLDAGRELLGIVLGAQQLELGLAPAPRARTASLPPEPGGQTRPLGSYENCDGTGEQSDPEPAHGSIVPTSQSSSDVLSNCHSLGSTGSLSSASTPNTHSWTLRRDSSRTNRSSASIPRANSRAASERLRPRPRERSRSRFAGSVYSGP